MRILITAIAFLALVAPAQASWQQDRALEIAKVVWHSQCVDQAKIVLQTPDQLGQGSIYDPSDRVMARGDAATCTIRVSTDFAPTVAPWEVWCKIVLHESGHLAGFRDPLNTADPLHSRNVHSIMYYGPVYDARCAKNGRPFLERHGLLQPAQKRAKIVNNRFSSDG